MRLQLHYHNESILAASWRTCWRASSRSVGGGGVRGCFKWGGGGERGERCSGGRTVPPAAPARLRWGPRLSLAPVLQMIFINILIMVRWWWPFMLIRVVGKSQYNPGGLGNKETWHEMKNRLVSSSRDSHWITE